MIRKQRKLEKIEKEIRTALLRVLYGQELIKMLLDKKEKSPIEYSFYSLFISYVYIALNMVEKELFIWLMPEKFEEEKSSRLLKMPKIE